MEYGTINQAANHTQHCKFVGYFSGGRLADFPFFFGSAVPPPPPSRSVCLSVWLHILRKLCLVRGRGRERRKGGRTRMVCSDYDVVVVVDDDGMVAAEPAKGGRQQRGIKGATDRLSSA